MNHSVFQRVCVWSGLVCPIVFFAGLLIAGMIPPLLPSMSAAEVAAHYRDHANAIRAGGVLIMVSSMFYPAFTAVMSGQMRRIPGLNPTVVYTQLAAGAFGSLTFLVPGLLFMVTSFRPERSPELTQMLNDMSWIFLVAPWPPFMTQNFAFAYGIFSDKQREPLFPRWLAYVNVWAPIIFTPAVLLPFFRSGPFTWGGIFVFWIPATVFGIQFIANLICLLKAVNRAEPTGQPQASHGPALAV